MVNTAWCGYVSPYLGRCCCGEAANHEPGGKYHKAVVRPDEPVKLTKPLHPNAGVKDYIGGWRLDERSPLYYVHENNPSIPLVWREPRYGLVTVELRGRWAR